MREQMIEVSTHSPALEQANRKMENSPVTSYPGAAFWLHVFPPLSDYKTPQPNTRMICPWSMAAELADDNTTTLRRQNIMEALKRGLKTIRQYDLPARRILFAEERITGQISVWVD